ncbi:MAG: RsmD family RNA methyltransferase [Micropruina sp.]
MSRIIAGSHKGHRLATPPGEATRPTSDRVREAVFGMLASELGRAGSPSVMLAGCGFLDLYAGSGAVALEAASRGADRVVAVEHDRRAAEVNPPQRQETGLAVRVVPSSVEKYLAGPPQPFDICWLDPPYAFPGGTVDAALARIAADWLTDDGIVIVERSRRAEGPQWPGRLGDRWQRRYGETTLHCAREGDG